MTIDKIKRFEVEITSICNAACPKCHRTINLGKFDIVSLTIDDIKRILPDERHIKDKQFLLCGAIGDPVANKDCYAIVEYLISMGGWVEINSNASLESEEWWARLARLSAQTRRISVWFCVDGHRETNIIYRVNTNFDIIERNMQAFADAGKEFGDPNGQWIYVLFDHNLHEVEIAKEHARRLGFKFATRRGTGNSNPAVSVIKKKDKETKEIIIEKNIVKASDSIQHSQKFKADLLKKVIKMVQEQAVKPTKSVNGITVPPALEKISQQLVKTVKCKYIHEDELFIASNQTLWPCCFLWTDLIRYPELKEKLKEYNSDWNSLKTHSIDEILSHPWYQTVLEQSWNFKHPQHFSQCIKSCGFEQADKNEIKYVE